MNTVILVGDSGKESMRKVFQNITSKNTHLAIRITKKKEGKVWRVYTDPSDLEVYKDYPVLNINNCKVIRFGTQTSENLTFSNCIFYNKAESLENASNKIKARKIFESEEISIPKTYFNEKSIDKFPVIRRPEKHRGGKDLVLIKDFQDLFVNKKNNNINYYYSELINKTNEYRIHVASGKILSLLEKPRPLDNEQIAWNIAAQTDAEDWKVVRRNKCSRHLLSTAIKAVSALGLDYGSVDIITINDQNDTNKIINLYVLEVNTTPDLRTTNYNSNKFAKYFDLLALTEEKLDFCEDYIKANKETLKNDYFHKFEQNNE